MKRPIHIVDVTDEYVKVVVLKDGEEVDLNVLRQFGVEFKGGAPLVKMGNAKVGGANFCVTANGNKIEVLHEDVPSWAISLPTSFGVVVVNGKLFVYVSYADFFDMEPRRFIYLNCDILEKYANLIMFKYAKELAENLEKFSGYKPIITPTPNDEKALEEIREKLYKAGFII